MPEFEPHTRNEALLNAIRENTGGGAGSVDFEPHSRNEYLLNEIRKNTEGSGSGLPDVSDSDNGKILGVENGAWGKMDAPSGLPGVTSADNGKALKVTNGAWGMGNNIHWLEGGSTYLPYTQTFLTAVMDAIPVMLQNNYMSYTVAVNFNETVSANVVAMAQEIYEAFANNETPFYRANGITGFNDMICPLKYVSFDPAAPVSNFDLLVNGYIYYSVPDVGPFTATLDLSITRKAGAATGMFVRFDRLVHGAHS